MTAYIIYSTLTDRNIRGLRGSSALSLLHSFMLNSVLADRQLDQTHPVWPGGWDWGLHCDFFPWRVISRSSSGSGLCPFFRSAIAWPARHVCVLTSWLILSVGLRGAELSHCEHRISEICSQSELSPAPHETSSDIKSRCSQNDH